MAKNLLAKITPNKEDVSNICVNMTAAWLAGKVANTVSNSVFHYDLKVGKNLAWLITCFVPLILFLAGIKNFISVISFVGGVMLGIDGILILLMYGKISKKKFLIYPLSLVLLGGIIYEIIYFLR